MLLKKQQTPVLNKIQKVSFETRDILDYLVSFAEDPSRLSAEDHDELKQQMESIRKQVEVFWNRFLVIANKGRR